MFEEWNIEHKKKTRFLETKQIVWDIRMNHQLIRPSHKQIKSAGLNTQSGMATALLIAIIALLVIFVAAGVYAVKNRQIWIAHGITAAMSAVINKSGLPSQEKSQVTELIYQINQGYLAGEISAAELGLIFEGLAKCPALTIGIVTQFEQSYVMPSGLGNAEKLSADTHLNRLARGLSNGKVGLEIAETILAGISDIGEDGTHHLKAPGEVSDEEIRAVLVAVKNAADEAGISEIKIEIDISDEFKKSVEQALGRSLT
jgi:hypothetical protein